jgi:hypothetical protein
VDVLGFELYEELDVVLGVSSTGKNKFVSATKVPKESA